MKKRNYYTFITVRRNIFKTFLCLNFFHVVLLQATFRFFFQKGNLCEPPFLMLRQARIMNILQFWMALHLRQTIHACILAISPYIFANFHRDRNTHLYIAQCTEQLYAVCHTNVHKNFLITYNLKFTEYISYPILFKKTVPRDYLANPFEEAGEGRSAERMRGNESGLHVPPGTPFPSIPPTS